MKDIFQEDKLTPIKGLIRRYKDRVLIELTLSCPVECDFCYRKWKKGQCREKITIEDIDNMVKYVVKNKEIKQIIFSGGEPLMELGLLKYAFKKFSQLDQIKTFRIHTRAPITVPEMVTEDFLSILNDKYKQIVYLSIHVNQFNELTPTVESAIKKIRQTGVILYSQSVFLKGINDSVKDLKKLFSKLVELGVRPYNIYQCNRIKGIEKYIVPIKKEIEIMTELRKKLSGFCCPSLIIDIPGNANKIPTPLFFWGVNLKTVKDFEGNLIKMSDV
ncbi:MAG: KamA family radical SAM protein [Candidatus Shapirobacteria bacterium]|nr:KamA family radical SAM protein [Candidatus Shapirobacteria bacterium]